MRGVSGTVLLKKNIIAASSVILALTKCWVHASSLCRGAPLAGFEGFGQGHLWGSPVGKDGERRWTGLLSHQQSPLCKRSGQWSGVFQRPLAQPSTLQGASEAHTPGTFLPCDPKGGSKCRARGQLDELQELLRQADTRSPCIHTWNGVQDKTIPPHK